jgi:UDP-N-acetylenolpyruvoylglucosamine reductase
MIEALRESGIPFREGEPLARHTTMGVGGPAAVMAFPRSPEELRQALRARAELGVPHRILGGGSNLVVVDEGLDELVVNTEDMRRVDVREDGTVTAEGGANLIRTVVRCCRAGYGFSISDVLKEIVVYDENGERAEPPNGWRFHYRGSSIPEGAAVASMTVALRPDDPEVLAKETHELSQQRTKSQPGGRNAGCVFKNAPNAPAGKLIDGLGLKGARRGGAVVSPRHANFVVNDGDAKASDVLDLLHLVHERVAKETGVDLELEVKVWRPRA